MERASQLLKRKQAKAAILQALYAKAQESVALPVSLESQAIATFRLTLAQHLELCRIRTELEETAHELLQDQLDYQILRSVPGVGPIIALTVLAEPATCIALVMSDSFSSFVDSIWPPHNRAR